MKEIHFTSSRISWRYLSFLTWGSMYFLKNLVLTSHRLNPGIHPAKNRSEAIRKGTWGIKGIIRPIIAGKHHKPLGHANISGWGRTRTCDVSLVTDLQSAALAARHTHPFPCAVREEPADAVRARLQGVTSGSRIPHLQSLRSEGPLDLLPACMATICCTAVVRWPT